MSVLTVLGHCDVTMSCVAESDVTMAQTKSSGTIK